MFDFEFDGRSLLLGMPSVLPKEWEKKKKSANTWLLDRFGQVGAALVQFFGVVLASLCFMFCFCTLLLTFAKAMILRWVGVVMPSEQVQIPLLRVPDMDNGAEIDEDAGETNVALEVIDSYPF